MHIFLASLPPGASSSDVCFLVGFTVCSCVWIMALIELSFLIPNFRLSHLLGIKWQSVVGEHQTVSECYVLREDCIHLVLIIGSALFKCSPS